MMGLWYLDIGVVFCSLGCRYIRDLPFVLESNRGLQFESNQPYTPLKTRELRIGRSHSN